MTTRNTAINWVLELENAIKRDGMMLKEAFPLIRAGLIPADLTLTFCILAVNQNPNALFFVPEEIKPFMSRKRSFRCDSDETDYCKHSKQ